jgi:cytochrome c556
MRMLASKSRAVRVHAAWALARAGGETDALLPTLLDGLQSASQGTRIAAASGLTALGAAAAASLPDILRAVEREGKLHFSDRAHYAYALAAVGRHDIPTLAAALSSPSVHVRYDTTEALKKIGAPAIPTLAKLAKTGSPELIEILGASAAKVPEARKALEAVARSEHPATRLRALDALWDATRDARAVVPGLLDLVAIEEIQVNAAYQLSRVGARAAFAIGALREAHANATHPEVINYLVEAIEKIERR